MNGMNASNLSSFAYVSEAYLKRPAKAVSVVFPGLCSTEMKSYLDMPDIRYLIIHGFNDKSVNKAAHSDKLVKLMRKRKLDVTYVEDDMMGHCNPMKYDTVIAIEPFIYAIIK